MLTHLHFPHAPGGQGEMDSFLAPDQLVQAGRVVVSRLACRDPAHLRRGTETKRARICRPTDKTFQLARYLRSSRTRCDRTLLTAAAEAARATRLGINRRRHRGGRPCRQSLDCGAFDAGADGGYPWARAPVLMLNPGYGRAAFARQ